MQKIATGTTGVRVTKFTPAGRREVADTLAEEEPLEIKLHFRGRAYPVAITMRTPGRDVDLATGFLFTEGVLPPRHTIGAGPQVNGNSVEIPWPLPTPPPLRRLERHGYTSSSCGVCGKTSLDMVYSTIPWAEMPNVEKIPTDLLPALPPKLRSAQELFKLTGGIHAAGLFDHDGTLLHHAEDVGRHNALDKVIGHYYRRQELPLRKRILVLSGRASFELIQKAAMAGIDCVISVGAPSSLAVALAEEQGIVLCGFVRAGGFNCYCGVERLG